MKAESTPLNEYQDLSLMLSFGICLFLKSIREHVYHRYKQSDYYYFVLFTIFDF